jgi:hypothetical protein
MKIKERKAPPSAAVAFGIGKLIRFKIFSHLLKTGWTAGIRVMFRSNRSLHKAEHQRKPKKFTAKPILNILTTKEKIALGYRVYLAIANDPAFVSPFPTMLTLHAVTGELEEALYNYIHGGEVERVILKVKEEAFEVIFKAVMMYVEEVAMGNKEIYEKAGMSMTVQSRKQ